MTTLSFIWSDIERWARDERVLEIGSTALEPLRVEEFREWLASGYHGSMSYLERHAAVRENPLGRYPWARSAVVITVPYAPERPSDGSIAAHIARYAQGEDYHDVLDAMLRRLETLITALAPDARTWRYVDTGPLSDRALGVAAGLGWIGRNAMLIHQEHGSWFFIGMLLTSLENDREAELASDRCGTCTRCIEACPTDAILPGRIVDSNRCISHATIEQRGELSAEMSSSLGSNVFGCDICQEVCPWNRRPAEGHPSLEPRDSYRARPVSDLMRMTQDDFSTLFRRSAVKRAKRTGMARNSVLVSGDSLTRDELHELCDDPDPGIAAAARAKQLASDQVALRSDLRSRSDDT